MVRWTALALILPASTAAAAADLPLSVAPPDPSERWKISEPAMPIPRQGISLPVIGEILPNGLRKVRSGVVAGIKIAPNTLVGFGLFEMTSKKRKDPPDTMVEPTQKRSRKAAIGVSLRF